MMYMFQFALWSGQIYEDTWLITLEEAEWLRNRYYDKFISDYKLWLEPQMVIWKWCDSITDYWCTLKELDYRDNLEILWWKIYKIETKKTLVE